MYFVKARKHLEEQDVKEPQEKSRRDRYQRSDSARLLFQALQTTDGGKVANKQVPITDLLRDTNPGLSGDTHSDFKPEELPDGAFYRPKKDLKNLQAVSSTTAAPSSSSVSSSQDVPGSGSNISEHARRAEYIGTFSVSGNDKEARERQMESQLEQMRSARDRMPVNLIISNSGVKVLHHENNNVFMEHSLKRIWYATCDPEYCQFSFLAREPKTSAETQYCHAFVTQTSEQAEELISIIGEAFKSTADGDESKKPPTFHELIEQQVQQQQAKFRETEKEAQSALQQKLKEIATPTPFSERAQFRMEQRRKSEDASLLVEQEKMWSTQPVDQHGVKHSFSPEKSSSNIPGNRRSEIPTRQNTPQTSPLKRNSVPPQAAMLSSPKLSSSSPNALSVLAIRESMETRSSNTKFKGSPVTALKNEIDRRLSLPNGEDLHSPSLVMMERQFKKDQAKPPKAMTNRPLPIPPSVSKSPQQARRRPGGQQPLQQSQPLQSQHSQPKQPHQALQRHSMDDYHIPRSCSSQIPLSSNARGATGGNVVMRNSPKRIQPRPMSEIATSSSGVAGSGAGVGGRGFGEQQRQTSLDNSSAGFNLPAHPEGGPGGMYIYSPSPLDQSKQEAVSGPHQETGRHLPAGNFGREEGGPKRRGADDELTNIQKSEIIRPLNSSQPQTCQSHIKPGNTQSGQGGRPAGVSDQVAVPRYQNDSPFQNERSGEGSKNPAGFESLMCLDRSHIHDAGLRGAVWYHAGLPREIALEILQQEEVGSFIVRDSTSHPGCYALSVRVPKFENTAGISHYLILRTHRGVKLKGLDKEWSSLPALVTHHTLMRELLPCTLRLPKVKGQEQHTSPSQSHGGASGSTTKDNESQVDTESYSQS